MRAKRAGGPLVRIASDARTETPVTCQGTENRPRDKVERAGQSPNQVTTNFRVTFRLEPARGLSTRRQQYRSEEGVADTDHGSPPVVNGEGSVLNQDFVPLLRVEKQVKATILPPASTETMSAQRTLFHNPLFRWGMPAATAAIVAGIAFFLIEDQTLRLLMLVIAGLDFVVTPQVLKRATRVE